MRQWHKLGDGAWYLIVDGTPAELLHLEDVDSFPPLVEARAENERLREALRIEERFQRLSGNRKQANALASILDGTTDWPTTPAWSQSETAPTPRPPDVDQLRSALRDIAAIADRAKAWNIKARQDVLDICAASLSETGGEAGEHEAPECEWYCDAVAVGLESVAGTCSPDRPIHNAPCGWTGGEG